MPDATTSSATMPWFAQDPSAANLSTTPQDGARNQNVNGIAQDISTQNTSLTTAMATIVTALNAKPTL